MEPAEDSRPPVVVPAVPDGWRVEVVESSGSTNAEVADRFRAGEPEGLVLVAEHQTAGRGRLGRSWVTTPRTSLTVSFLVVPAGVPPERWSWLPLLTGVAAADAVRRTSGLEVGLKWPNDVLAGDHKLGGILLERVEVSPPRRAQDGASSTGGAAAGAAAVIGVGVNCHQTREELPVPEATSLALEGARTDRSELLAVLVAELDRRLREWAGEGAADLRAAYLDLCTTPGREVRVLVPGGEVVGTARDIDEQGRLVVETATGEQHLGAGDVVHVRPHQ